MGPREKHLRAYYDFDPDTEAFDRHEDAEEFKKARLADALEEAIERLDGFGDEQTTITRLRAVLNEGS
jgi:hypothetical protein